MAYYKLLTTFRKFVGHDDIWWKYLRGEGSLLDRHIAQEKGQRAEERFLRICRERQIQGQFPEWLTGVVSSPWEDDLRGIDFWAYTTDNLRIGIQVKSSEKGKLEFMRQSKNAGVICLVVNYHHTDSEIYESTLSELIVRRVAELERGSACE